MYYAVDSDLFPVWLEPVSMARGTELIESGEAHSLMPYDSYQLVWAKRFDVPARWYVFPRVRRASLTIYV